MSNKSLSLIFIILLSVSSLVSADDSVDAPEIAWKKIESFFKIPDEYATQYGDLRSPLTFYDGRHVKTPKAWCERRNEILNKWHDMMGAWPPFVMRQNVEFLETIKRENFTQHRIRFSWMPNEKTEGYLLIPDGVEKRPAVITVYYEPESAIGLGKLHRDFAYQLTRRGFVTLSLGTSRATEAQTFGLFYPSLNNAEVQPVSMLAYAAANAWFVLAERPEVDARRIGIVGHSFGGKWALFASCLFDKFACAVWSDPCIIFDESCADANYWEPWYLGYHKPPWRVRGIITRVNPAKGLYPRLVREGYNLHELHALMAPRPFLVSGGSVDQPDRWVALNHTIAVNELLGFKNRVGMTNRPEHNPTPESNEQIYLFFEYFLKYAK